MKFIKIQTEGTAAKLSETLKVRVRSNHATNKKGVTDGRT